MVGSFVRFFFTRCEESLNSLVRCAHSFVRASRNSWRKIVRTHQPWSNLYLPESSVISFTFPVAASVTNIVSPPVQILCGWTKVQLFAVPSSFASFFANESVKAKVFLKDATRLFSEQELVSLFKRKSTSPPAKLKEYKPPTVLGPQKRNKLSGHKQPAIL